MVRAGRAVAADMVFLPFACVEAAANIPTNPAPDPCGKIPKFKFSAGRLLYILCTEGLRVPVI